MNVICRNVSKQYSNKVVLDNINVKFETGMNLLIGANGAGKSTLINILATINTPSSGNIVFENNTIYSKNYKSKLGYLPQDFSVYENITGNEFLMYMSCIKGINREKAKTEIKNYLQMFNLTQSADNRMSSYSGGMKQRIGIIQALLTLSKIIILDEPFNSLDPEERRIAKNILKECSINRVIILSSHVLQELEEFEGKLIILDEGKIVADTYMKDLKISNNINFLESYYFDNIHKSKTDTPPISPI